MEQELTDKQDERVQPRIGVSIPVGIRLPDDKATEGWGRVLDISPEGVRLETRLGLKVGYVLYLTFSAGSDLKLENLRGRTTRISWEDGYHIAGITFDDSVDRIYLREAFMLLLANQTPSLKQGNSGS